MSSAPACLHMHSGTRRVVDQRKQNSDFDKAFNSQSLLSNRDKQQQKIENYISRWIFYTETAWRFRISWQKQVQKV